MPDIRLPDDIEAIVNAIPAVPRGLPELRWQLSQLPPLSPNALPGVGSAMFPEDATDTVSTGGGAGSSESIVTGPPPGSTPGSSIVPHTLDIAKFARTLKPVSLLASLPTLPDPNYPEGTIVYWTGGVPPSLQKVQPGGTTWDRAVAGGADIMADSITAGQIQAGAITASEIAAGAVTAEKLLVGAGSGGLYLTNPGFETGDLTGWSGDGLGNGAVGVERVVDSGIKIGTGIYQVSIRRDSVASPVGMFQTAYLPCKPGDTVQFSGLASGGAVLYIFFYTETTAYITQVGTAQTTMSARYSVSAVAPATAFLFRVGIYNFGTSTYPNWIVCDDFRVSCGSDSLVGGEGNVLINESGITITNGKMTLQDEYGATVMTASGFAGMWSDFVADGLYNSRFRVGTAGALADGRNANLPYWEVARVGSPTGTVVADSTWPGGRYVEIAFSAVGDYFYLYSDKVPVIGGQAYSISALIGMTYVAGDPSFRGHVAWYDAAGTYINSSGTILSDNIGVTSDKITELPLAGVIAPDGAAYGRAVVYGRHLTTYNAGNRVRIGAVSFARVANAVHPDGWASGYSATFALGDFTRLAATAETSIVMSVDLSMTANEASYNPGNYSIVRITPDAARTFYGIISSGSGKMLYLFNIGTTFDITLAHLSGSAGSTTYRIACPGNVNYVIPARGGVTLWYDSSSALWRVISK